MNITQIVEAVLFASDAPLKAEEIAPEKPLLKEDAQSAKPESKLRPEYQRGL